MLLISVQFNVNVFILIEEKQRLTTTTTNIQKGQFDSDFRSVQNDELLKRYIASNRS